MGQITITLQQDEQKALWELAERECRDPRDQIRVVLRQELERLGLLQTKDDAPGAKKISHTSRRRARETGMDASATLTLDAETRRRLSQVYGVILDCAQRARGETADDCDPWAESSSSIRTVKRLGRRQLKRESDEHGSQGGEKVRE